MVPFATRNSASWPPTVRLLGVAAGAPGSSHNLIVDLGFTADEEGFRQEIRTWLDLNLPAEWRGRGVGGFREEDETDLQRRWQRRLHEGGWLKLAWPLDAGGRAATPVMQAIYQEEMAKAG